MIILAYRGTNSTKQLVEELATVLGKSKVPHITGGHVQEYFSNANDQLYPCVRPSIRNTVKKYPEYRVMITGHSLGGAIASIASAQLVYDNVIDKDKTTLYTFGMPRTGDIDYAERHDDLVPTSWRIVHYRDVVAQVPTRTFLANSPYHHQREIFYGKDMTVTTDYIECFQYEDADCSNGLLPSLSSIDYHKTYYEISVGEHCDIKTKKRRKRSDEPSDLSHLFTSEACKIIHVSDLPPSSANKLPLLDFTTTVLLLMAILASVERIKT